MTDIKECIRVMLVDDHEMVRQGLAIFIETVEDLELVGEASNGLEAIETCAEVHPHVILMDLIMPEMDGVEATQQIRSTHPDIQIIALTSFKDKELVQASLKAGAISYILKNASIDELASAIRAARLGRSVLSPEATQALIQMATQPPTPNYNLTEREIEVLAYVVEGLSNPQIADQLSLSRFTIKAYVSNILSKLGVASRSEAVAVALQNRLLE